MRRWVALAPLAVLAALAALFLGYGLRHDPHVTPAALVGRAAPVIAMPPLDGGAPRPAAEPGRAVLVNFFASWCVPCAVEAPALAALKAQGVRIVGVSYKDDPAATRGFLASRGDPFATILVDADGRAGVEWGVSGVPETFVVSPAGKVMAKHAGPLEPQDAERLLEAASHGELAPVTFLSSLTKSEGCRGQMAGCSSIRPVRRPRCPPATSRSALRARAARAGTWAPTRSPPPSTTP